MGFTTAAWNEHSEVSRCLLELLRRTQDRMIDPEQFVAGHLARYPQWADRPGAADTLIACELARALGLAATAQVSLDPDQLIRDAKRPDHVGTLLFLERWPSPENPLRLEPLRHCVLATQFDERFVRVWNPFHDGTAQESAWSWKSWPKLMMHGLALFR
jgi:hypothetical protein